MLMQILFETTDNPQHSIVELADAAWSTVRIHMERLDRYFFAHRHNFPKMVDLGPDYERIRNSYDLMQTDLVWIAKAVESLEGTGGDNGNLPPERLDPDVMRHIINDAVKRADTNLDNLAEIERANAKLRLVSTAALADLADELRVIQQRIKETQLHLSPTYGNPGYGKS